MRILVVFALAASSMWAQTAFESASARRVEPGKAGNTVLSPQGAESFSATSVTLDVLIELAYGVNENQLAGKPEWLSKESYDVALKPKGAGGLTYAQLRPALQELLAKKFRLTLHRETQDYDGFALVVDKGGSKLKVSDGAPGRKYVMPEGIYFQNTSLATFAAALAIPVHRPVIDKTGLTGQYDIRLEYTPGAVEEALPRQLGLRLEPQKVPIEMLVIDKLDRIPEN